MGPHLLGPDLAIGTVRYKTEGMLLPIIRWRLHECVVQHERNVHEQRQPCICGANIQ